MTREAIVKTFECSVAERIWGPDDLYLVVPLVDMQVFAEQGWKKGQRVTVTMTITPKEG